MSRAPSAALLADVAPLAAAVYAATASTSLRDGLVAPPSLWGLIRELQCFCHVPELGADAVALAWDLRLRALEESEVRS